MVQNVSNAFSTTKTSSHSSTVGNIASIMINPGSRRGSNSSYRKTVSFDIISDNNNESNYINQYDHNISRGGMSATERNFENNDDACYILSKPSQGTNMLPSEPLFKFCTARSGNVSTNEEQKNRRLSFNVNTEAVENYDHLLSTGDEHIDTSSQSNREETVIPVNFTATNQTLTDPVEKNSLHNNNSTVRLNESSAVIEPQRDSCSLTNTPILHTECDYNDNAGADTFNNSVAGNVTGKESCFMTDFQ